MSRRRLLPLVALVAIALVTTLAVVLVASVGGGDTTSPAAREPRAGGNPPVTFEVDPVPGSGLPESGIEARGVIEPSTILFGDTIRARVDVFLDRRKIDPASVRVGTAFVPWELSGPQQRIRRDAGSRTYLRTTYTLRCTSSPCLPADQASALDFNPARVSYASPGAAPGTRQSIPVDWPTVLVYSRFAAPNLDGPTGPAAASPWRADLEALPAVSYGPPAGLLIPVALVLAALLAAGGAALAYVAIPRRGAVPEPEPEPEPEPVVLLTPLEQALELLEDASRADGVEDRRRALELVAEVLDLGHPDLARAARTLAWSEDDPLVEQTSGLATRVRTTIDAHGNGNGHVR
jgi:hypothetical protein